ncbi:TIGR03503 family protein [Shewanella chilikensis]|uniref:TIGR03503 family protein n=1 Tax=Shewanella chilikensis TaxID=558541 RepID=UPI001F2B0E9A|nr:TIGR03503 family protein [Shewanella chilikensis]MCE9854346.1 TIGR03503 family protein [Shewanella chilikensis]
MGLRPALGLIVCLLLGLGGATAAEIVPKEQASELKNRFRIDHMVDRIVLLVQREYGSAPVVVVLPDGSKWYASRHPENVKWTDGVTGDMISVENPVPGPWQLIGKVVPGSQITRVSELGIEVDELPQPLYQGERLKLTAHLTGDSLRMRLPGLEYLLRWTARFASSHQPGDENFAAGTLIVGSYQDNGEALDERPDDGTFTANINLNQPWGNYTLQVNVQNDVFEREFKQVFRLEPTPVDIKVLEPDDPLTQPWGLSLSANPDILRLEETYFDLELLGPAGLQLPLTVRQPKEGSTQLVLPQVSDFGSYRIKGTVFSTDKQGRELVLSLPERFFNFVEPPKPPPSAEEMAARAAAIAAKEEAAAKQSALYLIIGGNVLLLLFGVGAILFWRKRQSLKQALAAAEAQMLVQQQPTPEVNTLQEIDLTLPDEDEQKSNRTL